MKRPLALLPWMIGFSALIASPLAWAMAPTSATGWSGWSVYQSQSSPQPLGYDGWTWSGSGTSTKQAGVVRRPIPATVPLAVLPTSGYHGWTLSGTGIAAPQPLKLPTTSARVIILPPKTINIDGPNAGGPLTPIAGAPAPNVQLGAEFAALINQQRLAHGLPALQVDPALMNIATLKAQDLVVNNYFDHYSVRYGYPYDMMRRAGISFQNAGENLAGADSVSDAVNDLMASPGHRANILSPYYTETGYAVIQGGPYGLMIVQEFVG